MAHGTANGPEDLESFLDLVAFLCVFWDKTPRSGQWAHEAGELLHILAEFFSFVLGVADAVIHWIAEERIVVGLQRRRNAHLIAIGVCCERQKACVLRSPPKSPDARGTG